ncbi:TolC family protein [Fulvivirga sp. 29W222]|uniref:TolC family protein n=1 Tax=Fulvivirga marina TaxID=2494733 RepID=A0A937G1B7_9BACT|nr:TolC family protein [Fulvivirga marina]MBL6448170.1 TolC family protein [Fulvivirga marina]
MKRRMINNIITVLFCLVAVSGAAQSADSVIFSYADFYQLVMKHHPIIKQAKLLPQQAAQELRMARGGFDPKIEVGWNKKSFKDTEYYNAFKGALKIPVWFPVTPEIGVERNYGDYLNPEKYISERTNHRQVYGGVSVTVGRGLFIDERRAVVKQALVFREMVDYEQVKLINKLLLSATVDYWAWYYAYNNYKLAEQGINLAHDIFDRTRMAFQYGEVAAIDTVQAFITWQKRKVEFRQANIERINATLKVSNHLWEASGAPLELQDNAIPEKVVLTNASEEELTRLLELARNNHPELRKLDLKGEALMIDQRLAKENLKPRLDLGYYLLDQPFDAEGDQNSVTLEDNYKIGLNFSFPLFLRKERAKISQVKLKINDNSYERDFREREIINEINSHYNELVNTIQIVANQKLMVTGYNAMVMAERLNLQNGESDLFKLNVQVDKLIEAKSKLLKLNATYKKNEAYLYWSAGLNVGENL